MNYDFSKLKVLVIGDFMIDEYIFGSSERMSPEAPVPVLTPEETKLLPGGAGNVVLNLHALGANVSCLGYVGNDYAGNNLRQLLDEKNINTEQLFLTDSKTTIKKRFISNDKQVLRVDSEEIVNDWIPNITYDFSNYDLIILSDYNKGVLNNDWFTRINFKNIFVDPKKDNFSFYSNCSIITPNLQELEKASKKSINNDEELVNACMKILDNSNFKYIVAKRSERGMSIVGHDGLIEHIDAHKVVDADVTGAGDTVISTFSLVYTISNDIREAAKIANIAASIAVSKTGTATVTIEEINNYIKKNV
tara:strand:- start:27116 stop:28033 length:918 start_codon:yes stop_codon:yes gene_type:complete